MREHPARPFPHTPQSMTTGALFTPTKLGALTLVPLSILASGVTTAYVPGLIGLVMNLLWFFVNGVGVRVLFAHLHTAQYYFSLIPAQVDTVLSPISAYSADIMHARSAEVMAASAWVSFPPSHCSYTL